MIKNNNDKNNASYTKKHQDHIPCIFPYKVVCFDDKFSKSDVLYRRKNAFNKLIEAVLKECDYLKKIIKKDFKKNVVMFAEDEERFQLSNKCWIFNKLFDVGENKVKGHCYIIVKCRGFAH